MVDGKTYEGLMMFFEAENKAFEEAGTEVGEVEFICPICGGKAEASRYYYMGRIHGLGSGCKSCGLWHT